jgi:hypothetical protein
MGFDIFLKIHGCELMGEENISIDVEAVVLEGERTVPGQAVSFSMNEKTHRLAAMDNGRVRAQLLFPLHSTGVQKLRASAGKGLLSPVSTVLEVVPPGFPAGVGKAVGIPIDEVMSGKRSIGMGEVLTLPKGFYEVKADIVIDRGGVLEIQPGCTLEFDEEAGLVCQGVIDAAGTEEEKITFTAARSHWRNILLYGRHTDRTRMMYCEIEFGTGRVEEEGSFDGGGLGLLYTRNASILLEHLMIRENEAKDGHGGGIFIYDSAPVFGHSEIHRNRAEQGGGGLYIGGEASAGARLSDLKIDHNTCAEDGGGIYLDSVSPLFSGLEVIYNEARFGAGLYHREVEPDGLNLKDCKIAENISSAAPDDPDGISGDWAS